MDKQRDTSGGSPKVYPKAEPYNSRFADYGNHRVYGKKITPKQPPLRTLSKEQVAGQPLKNPMFPDPAKKERPAGGLGR